MTRTSVGGRAVALVFLTALGAGAALSVACGSFDAKESASDAAASEAAPADASLGDGGGDGGGGCD